jgi:hypothetical protein
MRTESVEIYSDASNAAIIRHPGRVFPGVLVQGDTLRNLCKDAADLVAALERGDPDAIEYAMDLNERLEAFLQHYQRVMEAHGLKLPYPR